MPLSLRCRQLPPRSVPFSKHTVGTPASTSDWSATMPEDPAPMTAVRGV